MSDKKPYRCMSAEEAESSRRQQRGFSEAPGGNAGAFLAVLAALGFLAFIGMIIYMVIAKIMGWQ